MPTQKVIETKLSHLVKKVKNHIFKYIYFEVDNIKYISSANITSSYAEPTVAVPAILAPVRSDFLTPILDIGLSLPPDSYTLNT